MKRIFREWRFWLFTIALVLSILSIGYNPGKAGVVVSSIDADSPLREYVRVGETLQAINEIPIRGAADLAQFEDDTGVIRVVHAGRISLVPIERPGLKIRVEPVETTNLALGMDLAGGTRVLLEPQYPRGMTPEERGALAQQIITTLETRANIYGLRELPVRPVRDVTGNTYVQIETPKGTLADIEGLLQRQGKFEAFIPRTVEWINDEGVLSIFGRNYTIKRDSNATIEFKSRTYGVNETFELGNLTFELRNITALGATLAAHVFTSEDIKFVHTDAANARVFEQGGGWGFEFGIIVGDAGARKFAEATADLNEISGVTGRRGDCYLDEQIELYLDRVLVSDLSIDCSLRGKVVNSVQISGGASTEEAAFQEMRTLQTVLKSGSLPVPLNTVRVDTVSPTLGQQFLSSVTLAGVLAFVGVLAVVYLRYRRIDVVLPMIFIALSEIVMILGLAAAIKWTIDLAAIAGVIASIGTGVNDQIVIADEALGKQQYTTKERIRRAFFIVFGAAATIVAAMVPLAFIGIGVMRGFAVTTMIGVFVGVFITRPLYGKLVEMMVKE